MLELFFVSEFLYLATTTLTKIGLCLFLLRVFPLRNFRLAMQTLIGTNVALFLAFSLVVSQASSIQYLGNLTVVQLLVQCVPVRYSWLFFLGEMKGTCINRNAATWVQAIINIAVDLVILTVPLVQLFTLKTSYSITKKVQVGLMFSIGIIVTICSVLRLRSLVIFMKSANATVSLSN